MTHGARIVLFKGGGGGMDFELSDRMKTILTMINEFMIKEVVPLDPEFIAKEFKDMLPVLGEKRAKVKQMELWAPNHQVEYGGMGFGLVEHPSHFLRFERAVRVYDGTDEIHKFSAARKVFEKYKGRKTMW